MGKCIALLVCWLGMASAAETIDVVHLKNGSVIRGTVVEVVPDERLKLETQDGNLFVFSLDDVERIERVSIQPRVQERDPDLEAARPAPIGNPYKAHRIAGFVGSVATWGISTIAALALGDQLVSTTALPVFGPLISYVRCSSDSRCALLPGALALTTLSTVVQVGSLAYLLVSTILEVNYRPRVALVPGPTLLGFALATRF